ncbi:MAG: citrate/2-methylcitrate synthase, partial [Cyanobacteriota bacterium]
MAAKTSGSGSAATPPPAGPTGQADASGATEPAAVREAPPPALAPIPFRPGLEGVPATQSAICDIDGTRGILTYRGYPLDQLARQSSFLETAYLLIWGERPTIFPLRECEQQLQMHRRVSFRIRDMMKCFPATGHPMDALQ